jgi:DNA-binding MarR family transcriptional regulator
VTAPEPAEHLIPLLKHALGGLSAAIDGALAPHGIDGREFAVLRTFAGSTPRSQQEAAHDLQVDRTTMVALVDALEAKDLVERRRDPHDRRRNVVEPTAAGRRTLRAAETAARRAEQRFLAPLDADAVAQLRTTLRTLVTRPSD